MNSIFLSSLILLTFIIIVFHDPYNFLFSLTEKNLNCMTFLIECYIRVWFKTFYFIL